MKYLLCGKKLLEILEMYRNMVRRNVFGWINLIRTQSNT